MSGFKAATCIAFFLTLTACSHSRKVTEPSASGEVPVAIGGSGPLDEAPRAQIRETEDSSEAVEERIATPYKSPLGEIAMDYNSHVEKWLRYFQGRGRGHMERYLSRSGRYLPMMKNVLRENGLPEDLVYVALIESGFTPQAHSHANAVGYWQFIKPTGRRYGLNVDPFIDERRDPVLSTRAAAEYFKSLYSLFGNWHLAMAAYNVGENRVKRSVMKFYTRDFWKLITHRRSFPAETKNYVPKFIAAAMIAKNPDKYGFGDVKYSDPLSYDTITLQNPISFKRLSANLNVDGAELRLLNPKFRGDFVPLSRNGETVVRIPVGLAADAAAAASVSVSAAPKVVLAEHFYYRIRRGDTLSTVARRHRTTVSRLRRENNLSNRALLRVGAKLRVPDNGGAGVQLADGAIVEDAAAPGTGSGSGTGTGTGKVTRTMMSMAAPETDVHVVRRGENLSTIAKRYGLAVAELLRLNNLTGRSLLRVGQRLKLREVDSSKSAVRGGSAKRSGKTLALTKFQSGSLAKGSAKASAKKSGNHVAAVKHTVSRGETLLTVSRKYGIRLQKLARANGVSADYRVLAGESLAIP